MAATALLFNDLLTRGRLLDNELVPLHCPLASFANATQLIVRALLAFPGDPNHPASTVALADHWPHVCSLWRRLALAQIRCEAGRWGVLHTAQGAPV